MSARLMFFVITIVSAVFALEMSLTFGLVAGLLSGVAAGFINGMFYQFGAFGAP